MRKIWIYILSLFSLALSAQKTVLPSDLLADDLTPKHRIVWAGNQASSVNGNSDITDFVSKKLGYSQHVKLKLIHQRSSQTLEHYHYELRFKDFKVFGAEVHVAVQFDGQIKLIQAPNQGFTAITGSLPKPSDVSLARTALNAQNIVNHEVVLIPDGDFWKPVTYAELSGPEKLHREVLVANGEIVYNNDLHKHFALSGPGDTTVNVHVFDPDPLTTAQVSYGGKYKDESDQSTSALDAERKLRTTTFTLKNGIIRAENDFVKITEFSDPVTAQTAKSSADFNYNRNQDQFEDVNVVYHITHYRKHIQALGFANLPSYQIHVDAHALSGSDQSFFSTSVFPYRLYFGEGGVDDAEDADVILHEFSHAVIYEAAPTGSKDTERKCIEEALCDYFAASYSREVSSFGANDVFSWDGHNEFWPGRVVNTNKTYSQASFSNGNYYAHTDLMASSLNELYRRLGRDKTDQLVLEACYMLTSSTQMPEFGRYVLISDSLLNGASNIRSISESFVEHGILSKVIDMPEVFASEDLDLKILSSNNFTDGGQVIIQSTIGLSSLSLFDINGRSVAELNLDGLKRYTLSAENFSKGIYIIQVNNASGESITQKLLRH